MSAFTRRNERRRFGVHDARRLHFCDRYLDIDAPRLAARRPRVDRREDCSSVCDAVTKKRSRAAPRDRRGSVVNADPRARSASTDEDTAASPDQMERRIPAGARSQPRRRRLSRKNAPRSRRRKTRSGSEASTRRAARAAARWPARCPRKNKPGRRVRRYSIIRSWQRCSRRSSRALTERSHPEIDVARRGRNARVRPAARTENTMECARRREKTLVTASRSTKRGTSPTSPSAL